MNRQKQKSLNTFCLYFHLSLRSRKIRSYFLNLVTAFLFILQPTISWGAYLEMSDLSLEEQTKIISTFEKSDCKDSKNLRVCTDYYQQNAEKLPNCQMYRMHPKKYRLLATLRRSSFAEDKKFCQRSGLDQ